MENNQSAGATFAPWNPQLLLNIVGVHQKQTTPKHQRREREPAAGWTFFRKVLVLLVLVFGTVPMSWILVFLHFKQENEGNTGGGVIGPEILEFLDFLESLGRGEQKVVQGGLAHMVATPSWTTFSSFVLSGLLHNFLLFWINFERKNEERQLQYDVLSFGIKFERIASFPIEFVKKNEGNQA